VLPHDVLNSRKRGFGAPIREWFRGPGGEKLGGLIMNSSIRRRNLFDYTFIARLMDEHQRGKRDWSFHLWALLNVSLWYDRWLK
jgi:asparagine synthase (glutamine-hydrolysing)